MNLFDKQLAVSSEDIEIILRESWLISWENFLLNPRRLRGSDFLMRWSQGQWSEERLIQGVNATKQYFALPYGPSGTAPDHDIKQFELYFERLEAAGLADIKRPDLLIFRISDKAEVDQAIVKIGGVPELPFTREDNPQMKVLLDKTILAVECENSLWKASLMPDYGSKLKPQKRLGGQLGLRKLAVLPTIILKEEDRGPLKNWQNRNQIPIHIWHVFYDLAYGISLTDTESLIATNKILPTEQIFQAPGGATTKKIIYKFYYHYGYELGKAIEEPKLVADSVTDKNGHILPYVKFQGGNLTLSSQVLQILNAMSSGEENGHP